MPERVPDFFTMVARGDHDAERFLALWGAYCHDVDDVIDENLWDAEHIVSVLALAVTFYSDPYYVRNVALLRMPVLMATAVFADSCIWEQKEQPLWKRQFADVMRHSGNEVINCVAFIQGGYDHMQQVSLPLMATCYIYHKDKYGLPQ